MKLTFIPLTRMVIARFEKGKYLKVSFDKLPNLGIWFIRVGRLMLFNDYRKLDEYYKEFEKVYNRYMNPEECDATDAQ